MKVAILERSTEQGHVKAEIYGIAAYFIEKATSKAAQWLEDHPNKGLANEINNLEILTINSSVVPVENIKEYLSDTDLRVVLEKISSLIEGLLHLHILETMNADYPAELVNPEDEGIQERMRSLMLNSSFRGGESFSAREFVLSATRAPAVFIPVTFHVGLAAFRQEFGRLPGTESELDHFAKIISPLLLKLARFNISDLRIFNDKHFGNQRSRSVLPVAAYDNK